jgi:glutamate synthase (ferredoxin)
MGFVVDVPGRRSHKIITDALTVLENLAHRGAGCEVNSGDGAGILLQIPHRFLAVQCQELGFSLPPAGRYGVGMLFLPQDRAAQERCQMVWQRIVVEEGQSVLGWRTVPVEPSVLGQTARACQPAIKQVFIGRGADVADDIDFERRLYIIRKRCQAALPEQCYAVSLSGRTLVYKGMLSGRQLRSFYPDLSAPDLESALALVHSRFSTNTFPSWERAHPLCYLSIMARLILCAGM